MKIIIRIACGYYYNSIGVDVILECLLRCVACAIYLFPIEANDTITVSITI
jgi:hypothetical protein